MNSADTWPTLRVPPDEAGDTLTDRIGIGDRLSDEKVVTGNQLQDLLDRAVTWRKENIAELSRLFDESASRSYESKGWEDFVGAEYSDRYMLKRIRELILGDNVYLSVLRTYVYTPEAKRLEQPLAESSTTSRVSEGTPPLGTQPTPSVDVFISHSNRDIAIADALVALLRTALNLHSDQIRCTSVPGYKLPHGAITDSQLRAEILQSHAFVGLITATSIESAYVLFELGARWVADRHLAPLLAAGAGMTALGGPLQKYNALSCDMPADIHQFIRDLGLHLHVAPEPAAAYQAQLDALLRASTAAASASALATSAASSASRAAPSKNRERTLSEDEIVGIIQSWLGSRPATENTKPIYFDDVDTELGLPSGSAKAHIETSASRYRYVVERKGPNLILFKEEPRPRVRMI